jgi:glycosyltransferase involved in cell wall biosynthesis
MALAFLIIFLLSLLLQLAYLLLLFAPLRARIAVSADLNPRPAQTEHPSVSVIICARNALDDLKRNLPVVLEQNYEEFEVLVVDDASSDGTEAWLKQQAEKHSHLRCIRLDDKPYPGKKWALSQGIEASKYPLLLMTDADCTPASDNWIQHHVKAHFTQQADMILGFGAYEKHPGWLNKLIRYETFLTALQYFSFANKGMPYMGVGRNISYQKSLYNAVGGFRDHLDLASGDDDLLVNAAAADHSIGILIDPASHTLSRPKLSWRSWYRQKQRHYSTAGSYSLKSQLLLGGYSLSQVLFYVTFFGLFAFAFPVWIPLSAYLLRLSVQLYIFRRIMNVLNSGDLWYFSTIFDLMWVGYYSTFVSSVFWRKTAVWP